MASVCELLEDWGSGLREPGAERPIDPFQKRFSRPRMHGLQARKLGCARTAVPGQRSHTIGAWSSVCMARSGASSVLPGRWLRGEGAEQRRRKATPAECN